MSHQSLCTNYRESTEALLGSNSLPTELFAEPLDVTDISKKWNETLDDQNRTFPSGASAETTYLYNRSKSISTSSNSPLSHKEQPPEWLNPGIRPRPRSGLGNVRLAVNASIARARADLLGLNVVVVRASVLVADFLDAADFDVGESGGVAVVGVNACFLRVSITMAHRTARLMAGHGIQSHQQESCPR